MLRNCREALVEAPSTKQLTASIVVPARNEEELLPSCLRALAEQTTPTGSPLSHDSYEIILLINNTTDNSARVAQSFRRLYPSLQLHILERNFRQSHAHIGYVRRLLMDEACRRLELSGSGNGIILSTDSDTQVASNWIVQNLAEFASGADAVAGRIVLPEYEQQTLDEATRAIHRYDHLYRRLVSWIEHRFDPEEHDPWPRHHQHFGASIGVRVRTYKSVGRLPPRRYLEDVAFYTALVRNDVRLRHSNRVKVFTSARLCGRAQAGLSAELRSWKKRGKNGLKMPVESRDFLEHLFRTRRALRTLWKDQKFSNDLFLPRVRDLSADSGIPISNLIIGIRSSRCFGELLENLRFYHCCRTVWPDWIRLKPLRDVVDQMLIEFSSLAKESRQTSTLHLSK